MWKRAKRIGLVLLAAGFGLGAAALIVIETSGFQQWLLRRLENVAGAAGYRLTAKRLDLNIWKLQASLEGVVYDDGKGTRVTVDRFFVDIPRNAFRGNLDEITDLEADGVSIGIRSAGPSEPSGKRVQPPRIVFRRLAIRNGSLTYSDPSTTVRIPSFDLEAQDGRGALRLGSPISISPDVRFAILELPLQISDESLDFGPSPFRIEHPQVTIMGSSRGHLQWSPSLAANFDYTTDPFSYRNWRDLESSANIRYENGTLRVMIFWAGSVAGN